MLVMFPFPTLLTERGTNVSVGTLDATWYTVDDDSLADKFLGIET